MIAFSCSIMCLPVEKPLVAYFGGPSSRKLDFRFRIPEGSSQEPDGPVCAHATFFNRQVRYKTLKRV